jgi:hypothetical protein
VSASDGEPAEDGIDCEWCDQSAKRKFPNMKKVKGVKGFAHNGTWTYCCFMHVRVAKEVSRNV